VKFRFERSVACYKFVDHDTESPDVYPLIVTSPNINLGRKVEVCSYDCEHIPSGSPREGLFGDSKVNDFYLASALVVEYVLGLYVSVADVVLMQILEA
jgi:hypothetical protein